MAAIPPRYRSRYFNHIFSSGYAAGYYSYIWSEILDADTVEWFTEHRDRLREAGDTFRAELLSRGGSGDEMGYFEAFRGRPPRIEPLLRRRGLWLPDRRESPAAGCESRGPVAGKSRPVGGKSPHLPPGSDVRSSCGLVRSGGPVPDSLGPVAGPHA